MEVIVQLAVLIIGALIVAVCTFLASKVMKLTEAVLKLTYELAELQRANKRLWKMVREEEKRTDDHEKQLIRLNAKVWEEANEGSNVSRGNIKPFPN